MEYLSSILILTGLFIILASSFNLVLGYGGLMSIAHPAFFGLGAYGSALLVMFFHVPVLVGFAFGAALALAFSIALALPSLRISGDYLVIASIAFQLGILQIIRNVDWTGGPGGLIGIPPLFEGNDFGAAAAYVVLVLSSAAVTVFIVAWLVSGAYGRAITAMRDDEEAFKALGRDPFMIKLVLFGVSSAFAGFAGALYSHYFLYFATDQMGIVTSSSILTMVVVGGVRTRIGPVIGALLLVVIPQGLNFLELPPSILGPMQGILFTGLVLLFLFVRPGGIVSEKAPQRPSQDDEELGAEHDRSPADPASIALREEAR